MAHMHNACVGEKRHVQQAVLVVAERLCDYLAVFMRCSPC